ncbi:hypothetical protein GCM10022222_41360 [Amycolatopsis ultiminotia]|uniref:Uncharacterized protein n=1 Tax=Amycolatopsis ultiminotia TaxID=543629 RepID=A0ABP6WLK1_9PSEU
MMTSGAITYQIQCVIVLLSRVCGNGDRERIVPVALPGRAPGGSPVRGGRCAGDMAVTSDFVPAFTSGLPWSGSSP